MTTPADGGPRDPLHAPRPVTRDLLAVLLIGVGYAVVCAAAWTWDTRAGAAVIGAGLLAVGVLLGTDT